MARCQSSTGMYRRWTADSCTQCCPIGWPAGKQSSFESCQIWISKGMLACGQQIQLPNCLRQARRACYPVEWVCLNLLACLSDTVLSPFLQKVNRQESAESSTGSCWRMPQCRCTACPVYHTLLLMSELQYELQIHASA